MKTDATDEDNPSWTSYFAVYFNASSFLRLFLEILNDCSDKDEIQFQQDGTWCPMKPKKESFKVPTPSFQKIERKYVSLN